MGISEQCLTFMNLSDQEVKDKVCDHWNQYETKYSVFCSGQADFLKELDLFREISKQRTKLACSLPVVISTILKTPFVLFTKLQHVPIIPIIPDEVDNDIIWIVHRFNNFIFLYKNASKASLIQEKDEQFQIKQIKLINVVVVAKEQREN